MTTSRVRITCLGHKWAVCSTAIRTEMDARMRRQGCVWSKLPPMIELLSDKHLFQLKIINSSIIFRIWHRVVQVFLQQSVLLSQLWILPMDVRVLTWVAVYYVKCLLLSFVYAILVWTWDWSHKLVSVVGKWVAVWIFAGFLGVASDGSSLTGSTFGLVIYGLGLTISISIVRLRIIGF